MFVLVASRYPAREADTDKTLLHVIGTPTVSSPILTYPHVCSRMLTYAGEVDSDKGLVYVMERRYSFSHYLSSSFSHYILLVKVTLSSSTELVKVTAG